jgi:catechol 2,3-dioxygenase-like lactoylglutathione lyase family enzyme
VIGRLHALVIDCPDPSALALFYEDLLGLSRLENSPEFVLIGDSGGTVLAFQAVANYRPPRWPDPDAPQQLHVDVLVDDLDAAESRVLPLGATLLDGSDKPIGYRVYADPAGHPFCLVTAESVSPHTGPRTAETSGRQVRG